jgi:hypothetical protein
LQELLNWPLLTYDIGIRPSLEKTTARPGPWQGKRRAAAGTGHAQRAWSAAGPDQPDLLAVRAITTTLNRLDGLDHQISDRSGFLVISDEGGLPLSAITSFRDTAYFRTRRTQASRCS